MAHADDEAEWKNSSSSGDVREFPCGRLGLIDIGDATVGRAVFQPVWR
jgi:hypothetical protein